MLLLVVYFTTYTTFKILCKSLLYLLYLYHLGCILNRLYLIKKYLRYKSMSH